MANMAQPAFPDVDKFTTLDVIRHPIVGIKNNPSLDTIKIGIVGQKRNYFWYKRNFELNEKKEVVILKISKAQFGTQVWVNGKNAGEHYGCFTAGYFDITKFVKQSGKNEIIVRIGAHPKALPEWVPFGTDLEKRKWTPGIFDDVTVIACNNPYIETLQIAPDINTSQVKVQTKVINYKQDGKFSLNYKINEWKGGKTVAIGTKVFDLKKNEVLVVDNVIDLPSQHLWSPDDPFLYTLDASSGGDNFTSRFGMREFHFDSRTQKAYLNNKIIYLRGSNICINRFFEDSLCRDNPWNEKWVRRLIYDIPKSLYWNSFRFCLGPPPEKWYEIADEAGLLIQNEFFLWTEKNYWSVPELETQLGEWMRDHWNHPSVVIWDMQNETRSDRLGDIINKFRPLDLSNRQWENGWSKPAGENDPVEDHNYLSYTDREGGKISPWRMPAYTYDSGAKSIYSFTPSSHASVLNEYAWLWLQRNGEPTILSKGFYSGMVPDYTTQQRMDLYGYLIAGETEHFRAFRTYAGVNFFTYLTADFPTALYERSFQTIGRILTFLVGGDKSK
jgi:beta-galactosidase/beta-glucuronidase